MVGGATLTRQVIGTSGEGRTAVMSMMSLGPVFGSDMILEMGVRKIVVLESGQRVVVVVVERTAVAGRVQRKTIAAAGARRTVVEGLSN